MKIRSADFDDDGHLSGATVTMTSEEMALIYAVFGHLSPSEFTSAAGPQWAEHAMGLASSLGTIGNMFYEAGWPAIRLQPSVGGSA